jgi:hypothetical protein
MLASTVRVSHEDRTAESEHIDHMAGTKGSRGWGHIRRLRSGKFQASYIHRLSRHNAPHTFSTRPRAEGWLADEWKLIELGHLDAAC